MRARNCLCYAINLILVCFFNLANANSEAPTLLLLTDDAPPHMIKDSDAGIDIDVMRLVLNRLGYQVKINYVPLERARIMVANGQADVTIPTFFQRDGEGIFLSTPVIRYKPTVFSLSERNLSVTSFSSLEGLNVSTFQGATGYFGPEFSRATKTAKYREMHDMSVLPDLLFRQRADVVVLDYYIFHFYARQSIEGYRKSQVSEFDLIPAVDAYAAFNDLALRNAFNQALKAFKTQGGLTRVINKYIGAPLNDMPSAQLSQQASPEPWHVQPLLSLGSTKDRNPP